MHTDTISHADILDLNRNLRLYEGLYALEARGWNHSIATWSAMADRLTSAALYWSVKGDRAEFMRARINDCASRAGTRLLQPGWRAA